MPLIGFGRSLRTHKLGEADRIIVLMTEGRGRCGRWPRGPTHRIEVRQPPREPGGHVAVQLHEAQRVVDRPPRRSGSTRSARAEPTWTGWRRWRPRSKRWSTSPAGWAIPACTGCTWVCCTIERPGRWSSRRSTFACCRPMVSANWSAASGCGERAESWWRSIRPSAGRSVEAVPPATGCRHTRVLRRVGGPGQRRCWGQRWPPERWPGWRRCRWKHLERRLRVPGATGW